MTKEELIIGFFEKGYCCDLDEVKDTCLCLLKENQELKKQVEEYENEPLTNKISRIDCVVSNIYSRNKTQQKEFILYLMHLSNWYSADGVKQGIVNDILQKYKSIIEEDKIMFFYSGSKLESDLDDLKKKLKRLIMKKQ